MGLGLRCSVGRVSLRIHSLPRASPQANLSATNVSLFRRHHTCPPASVRKVTSNFRERTDRHEQTHCIGNASEAAFESHCEQITVVSFSRMGCPNGFRSGSDHLSFDITTVTHRPRGRGLRSSGLASDRMSESQCHECSNSLVPPSRGHLFITDSVHPVLSGLFVGRICRAHRTVCRKCKSR